MFDDRLKKLREQKNFTQRQIAESLEMNPRTYSSYENNEREPNSEVLIMIADLFDVSIDYLLGLDESRIIKKEIGRKYNEPLSRAEMQLIEDYRSLSYKGKDHLQTTMKMYKLYFPISDNSDSDADDGAFLPNHSFFSDETPAQVAAFGGEGVTFLDDEE